MDESVFSVVHDDNEQLGNSQHQLVTLSSNSTLKWQISMPFLPLVILTLHHNNYKASYLSWA